MTDITIGKLAHASGVAVDTVRYYERRGLLPRARRTPSGYRTYTLAQVDRLRFIRRAKALGFSLDEIRELLALNDGKGARSDVRTLAQRRLGEIEAAIQDLERMREPLTRLVRHCSGKGTVRGCPIIEAVLGDS